MHSTFKWARYIWRKAWITAENFSADEQIAVCQGTSEYITRCGGYKRIGDGFPVDCLADNGYTFDFYFHNEPVDPKWIHMGLSPVDTQLMHMFCRLRCSSHTRTMNNLYNSVKFARLAYALEVDVMPAIAEAEEEETEEEGGGGGGRGRGARARAKAGCRRIDRVEGRRYGG